MSIIIDIAGSRKRKIVLAERLEAVIESGGGAYKRENFRVLGDQVIGYCSYIYTWGLMYGCDEGGYAGRFCYDRLRDCYDAFHSVNMLGHEYPPVDTYWIVQKGHPRGDRPNIFKNSPLEIEL